MITSIDLLKPLEKVFMYHLKNLSKMISEEGVVQTPIIADKKIGRNDKVTIQKGSEKKVVKYKKIDNFIRDGWNIVD